LRSVVLLVLWAGGFAVPLGAQVVTGELRDSERGRTLAGARLLLLTEVGETVDSTVSAADGKYRLAAPAAGTYLVHFQLDGFASVSSAPLRLEQGSARAFDFQVLLLSSEAIREMGEIMGLEPRLQQALPELCGEAFRPWEAGLLIGSVRNARGQRVAGAAVAAAGATSVRSTVSNDKGVYVLCNVPAGAAVPIITALDGVADTTRVEIRAGTASWYDLYIGR
jgi:hypothetical protein